jgi:hypothetical protein
MTDRQRIDAFVSEVGRVFYAPPTKVTITPRRASMAKEYDNTNKGALFRNEDKDPNDDRERDYSGTINIEGREFWLSGWVKTSKAGRKFLSLSVKPKEERAAADKSRDDFDPEDTIPF